MADLDDLAARQAGVVTRRQARECGLTEDMIRSRLRSGRWRRPYRGVYYTFTGEPSRLAVLSAVLAAAGPGAVLSHHTAAELLGLTDEPAATIHVSLPGHRRLFRIDGVRFHYRTPVPPVVPLRSPARTRVEDTVVDLTQLADTLDQAVGWIARACGRRLTTAGRLTDTIRARTRVRRRAALLAAVADVGAGAQSVLEVRYLRDVERGHGLPGARRQRARRAAGTLAYRDVEYTGFGLVVELDGRAAHDDEQRLRDRRRDNRSATRGWGTLRFGWADVTERPCATAATVAAALRVGGWRGTAARCGDACRITW
ncbi:type IV toxin-antitoxin system AbiEi family antitoxin domain-containing protein [Dactylosporangium sp. AC04546]|uniref:type IV toxin-antitoxin system AbiEi family antitoxin domain-containing protein n=1 Tax=Dactylosporangium sp. AC04546 TaxID=2862460 RepID=UPI001EDFD5D4|nr:type IV toxin-antitoxin system AbiEi family antitoxin domain-containing protein [Dactylosporangium sp. AC04546]WVK86025.1 type IV toxin-antitoxin system AbiEi family antitoxin domain-containing protein [Dactylosporangium sp. AC04546]